MAAYSPGCMYSGVLQCFREIYREGGLRRLYRGLGPSLLGIIPYAGIDLAVFESLKEAYVQKVILRRLEQEQKQQQGCSTCNSVSSSTVERKHEGNTNTLDDDTASAAAEAEAAAGHTQESPLGPARPPQASAGPQSPASRCRCCCDAGSSSSSGSLPVSPPAYALLLMGGCSSLIGQVAAYPTALIRTRLQVDGSGGKQLQYRSSTAAAAAALRQGGVRGLYRGLGANCCKALPAVSLSWIAYEKTKEAIRKIESSWSDRVANERNAAFAAVRV